MYVLESGSLDCTKVFSGNSQPTHLKVYQPGEGFGELALLYNCPRAATITAKTDYVCWKLDRDTFNHIVKDAAAKKREKYDNFLQTVDILKSMDDFRLLSGRRSARTHLLVICGNILNWFLWIGKLGGPRMKK